MYGSSGVDGLVFSVEHQSINFGSPDAETDPRTYIKVYTIAGVELGALVVRATNDYTMVVTMTDSTWAFDAEGASWWKKSGESSGVHSYDLSDACLRMESWCGVGEEFGSASVDNVSIKTVPEPTILGLVAFGSIGILLLRKMSAD